MILARQIVQKWIVCSHFVWNWGPCSKYPTSVDAEISWRKRVNQAEKIHIKFTLLKMYLRRCKNKLWHDFRFSAGNIYWQWYWSLFRILILFLGRTPNNWPLGGVSKCLLLSHSIITASAVCQLCLFMIRSRPQEADRARVQLQQVAAGHRIRDVLAGPYELQTWQRPYSGDAVDLDGTF